MTTPTPAPAPQQRPNWFVRHKILTGIGVLFLLGAIFGGGAGGSETSSANASDTVTGTSDAAASTDGATAVPADDTTTQAPAKATKPAKPAGNVIGNWTILTKHPKFGQSYGMFDTVKLDVKNTSDSEDEPWLEIRLTKGNRLVTTFDCVGQTVRPGEITTLECSSMDDYAPWADYEIKNAF